MDIGLKVCLVLIESPYAGDVEKNTQYARAALRDCLRRGEYPFASHLLYTQVLDDLDDVQRAIGIEAGLAWGKLAHRTVVYTDLGISSGMRFGINRAATEGRPVEYRSLPDWNMCEELRAAADLMRAVEP